ncbi:membrane protein [Streptomyces sulfonofaciens]|uniref:Membrane protein n=1 Tax=Streptomyces sulfonofaciens TaxID=68272 RepID=A0A919G9T1_9ACTN|nr:low temperature requirement protein A [Streptomyces sulfonofaciens]GHH80193.1 membrane protein [Streptomyces sulfonofaciens]
MTSGSDPASGASGSLPPQLRPVRRISARRRDESHRVASPLELFFDLCFVVAIAQAGGQVVRVIADGRAGEGLLDYAMIFFSIWWAWMQFSWFASAYDNDDVLYRLATLVQIAGVLVLAAGVSRVFAEHDFLAVRLGYAVMRLALTAQWLRVAGATTGTERGMALRYAGGVLLCQAGWLGVLVSPGPVRPWVFLAMAIAEICVSPYAERRVKSSWHPHHISERYGLFTIIVLSESVAAATAAVKSGIEENDALAELLPYAAGGLLLVFAAWWICFAVPIHGHLRSRRQAFVWGYGHYVIFASAAALGAGIEIAVRKEVGHADLSRLAANATVTVPMAVYLVTVWALHSRFFTAGVIRQLVLPGSAGAILACTFAGHWSILAAGLVAALTVATGTALTVRTAAREARTA